MNFEGKNALVTGASLGIGRAVTLELAKLGANVGINFRSNVEAAKELAEEITDLGCKAILLQGDVSEQSFVESMVAKCALELGSIDAFVSNAVYSDRQLMIEAEMEGFRRTVDVSMWGAFYGVRATAQQMVKQDKGGSIVIVSSPHATVASPTAMAYNMSKAAIDHMGRTAAIELARYDIRVNIIHPGWIDTPGERKFFTKEQLKAGGEALPLKRLGTPEEIARNIAWVLSKECAYMTGSTVKVDGGVTLPWWSKREEGGQ